MERYARRVVQVLVSFVSYRVLYIDLQRVSAALCPRPTVSALSVSVS